jgi:hypothetical protein
MIRKMLELRGDGVDRWYDAVNRGEEELAELVEFVERDELYTLKVYVEEGNEWIHREFIPGGGPFIYDDQYQVLPEVGDWAKVHFEVPPEKEGTKRSVFLKSTGYYEIHFSKDQPEQTELIRKILATPGKIHEFTLDEYLKWRSAQLSSN